MSSDSGETQDVIIVSRHAGAIEWLRQFPDLARAPVLASATADDVRDRIVVGNLPLHLAALARWVLAIEFDAAPRGVDYSAAAMTAAGARLVGYTIRARDYYLEDDSDGELCAVWIAGVRIPARPGETLMDVRVRSGYFPRGSGDGAAGDGR